MNTRQYLGIGFVAIFIGALIGLVTFNWAAWIGSTFIIFALLRWLVPLFSKRMARKGQVDHDAAEKAWEMTKTQTATAFNPNIRGEEEVPSGRGGPSIVKEFALEFSIPENKAKALYDAGYRRWGDLQEAIQDDLMMVPGINPTIARRIVDRTRMRGSG